MNGEAVEMQICKMELFNMERIEFKPVADSNASVVGYLHSPITEMEVHRESFPAVVFCPGGGYEMVSQREGDPVAIRFFARGYNVFILTYSVGEQASGFRPLIELSETVRAVRANKQWRVDPDKIAVCGFSAGGHLACSLGTMWDDPELLKVYDNHGGENRPNAMVLGYPVITADEFAHNGSIEKVSGCKKGTPGYEYFSLDKHISENTCRTFVWHTVEDTCVPIENTLKLLTALQANHISYEAHLFPHDDHGTSVCTDEVASRNDYNARWITFAADWLDHEFGYHL